MQGNFSKNPTAAYSDRVSRVLMQQGRVQLDSDWNEQTEAFLRFLRGLGSDVIGFHGGIGPDSFRIIAPPAGSKELPRIGWGCYYIDGLRCVNPPRGESGDVIDFWDLINEPAKFHGAKDGLLMDHQPDLFPLPQAQPPPPPPPPKQLVYLDAFERHIASEQDDAIREVALLGPDTASRAVVVWQVRTLDFERFFAVQRDVVAAKFPAPWDPNYLALNLLLRPTGKMRAQAIVNQNLDPCIISPEARFRGDNRLYRVEIHDPGTADGKKLPKIKWSADNASIVYPIRTIEGHTLFLDSLGRDDRTTISVGDWVEAVNDEITLMGIVKPLLQVTAVDRARKSVTLSGNPGDVAGARDDHRDVRPILRRWATNVVDLREGHAKENWIDLSDGVQVQFSGPTPSAAKPRTRWRTGDYWLIPARSATGDVIWPQETGGPRPVGPHGIDHHYAPLAEWDQNSTVPDLRFVFDQMAKKVPPT